MTKRYRANILVELNGIEEFPQLRSHVTLKNIGWTTSATSIGHTSLTDRVQYRTKTLHR